MLSFGCMALPGNMLDVWVLRAFVHDPMCVWVGLLQDILAACLPSIMPLVSCDCNFRDPAL